MNLSWTCCDECDSRIDVQSTEIGYLCQLCRKNLLADH